MNCLTQLAGQPKTLVSSTFEISQSYEELASALNVVADQENSPLPVFSDSRVPSPQKSKPVAILQESKNSNNDNF